MRRSPDTKRTSIVLSIAGACLLLAACTGSQEVAELTKEADTDDQSEVEQADDSAAVDAASPRIFDDELSLSPRLAGDPDLYPLGLPEPIFATLGEPEWVDPAEVDADYYGGFTGGTAQEREVILTYGDRQLSIDLTFPKAIPAEMLEANAGRDNIALDTVELSGVELISAGTPARTSCEQGGDIVAGWVWDGSPGTITVGVLIDIADDATLGGVGLVLHWAGEWNRQPLAGVDDAEIADGCDAEAGSTEWGWGTVLKDG